jgi:hypothetical protein
MKYLKAFAEFLASIVIASFLVYLAAQVVGYFLKGAI